MQLALRADSTECDYESGRSPSTSRRTKFLAVGVAMASASVLAVNPVTPTPAMPDVREAALELAAIANPLTKWQQTITNTLTSVNRLSTDIPAASTALAGALSNPAVQAELVNMIVNNAVNPLPLLTALANFPSNYGAGIAEGNEALLSAQLDAFAALPAALRNSAASLAHGQFLDAFSFLNVWLLVDFLSDARQELVDNGIFAIPGDFAESIGADPLARVFRALINRGMVGNLGRALLTAQITSSIQAMEILDRTRAALQTGDVETALSELTSMPAKFTNAFLNGYVPDFTTDPQFPPQTFPGLFSKLGFFDFFFVQVPKAIATALPPPPAAPAAVPTTAASTTLAPVSPTDVSLGSDSVMLTVNPSDDTSPLGETGGVTDDATKTTPDGNNDGVTGVTTGDDTTGDTTGDDDTPDDDTSDEDTSDSTTSDSTTSGGGTAGGSGTSDGDASGGGAAGGSGTSDGDASGGGAAGGSGTSDGDASGGGAAGGNGTSGGDTSGGGTAGGNE